MNWNWELRADGGMNGLEFAKATTSGGHEKIIVHAAPPKLKIQISAEEGSKEIASGEVELEGDHTPMTEITVRDGEISRRDIWLSDEHLGLVVILPGGEAGILTAWEHAEDKSWWKWAVEFSNHEGRPEDWSPDQISN